MFFFADAAAPTNSSWHMIVMIAVALLFFYFILWRPEQKRRKTMQMKRNSMKKGDRVTAMGIIGTVHSIEADTVILKMHDGAKIEFLKGAITDIMPAEKASSTPAQEKASQ